MGRRVVKKREKVNEKEQEKNQRWKQTRWMGSRKGVDVTGQIYFIHIYLPMLEHLEAKGYLHIYIAYLNFFPADLIIKLKISWGITAKRVNIRRRFIDISHT